jgi:hypothetical protein
LNAAGFHPTAADFFGGRPTVVRPAECDPFSLGCRQFLRRLTRRRAPADLSAESADSRPNPTGFHPITADCFGARPTIVPQPI